jgi:aspartate racemase
MPFLMKSGLELKRQGVDVIAVPCMTAHFFQPRLEKELGVPVIHAIKEAGKHLSERDIDTVGVMATDGTVETGLFQETMTQFGISCITPDAERQRKVMHLIYDDIKAGKPAEMDMFHDISDSLFERGAQAVLLGCTEISLIKRDHELGRGFLDVMEVLAQQSVLTCGKLRQEYKELISE